MQVSSKSLLSRSVSSRDPQCSRIQPGLWLSSGRGHRQGPKPLAHVCGKILQLFGEGQSHLGHTQRPGSLPCRLLQLLLTGTCGCWEGRCLQQGCCPWGSDVQDNLKSLPLCALASCHRFCPWLFWEHGGAAVPRHAFLASATRGSCQELPREERWAQRREMSPVDLPIPHPALCCPV